MELEDFSRNSMKSTVSTQNFYVSWKERHLEHYKWFLYISGEHPRQDVTDHICKLAKKGCGIWLWRDIPLPRVDPIQV